MTGACTSSASQLPADTDHVVNTTHAEHARTFDEYFAYIATSPSPDPPTPTRRETEKSPAPPSRPPSPQEIVVDGVAWDGRMSSLQPNPRSIEPRIVQEIASYDIGSLLNYKEPEVMSEDLTSQAREVPRKAPERPKLSLPAKRSRAQRQATPGPSTLPRALIKKSRHGRPLRKSAKLEEMEASLDKPLRERYVPISSSPLKTSVFTLSPSPSPSPESRNSRWFIPKRKLSPGADPSEYISDSDSDSNSDYAGSASTDMEA